MTKIVIDIEDDVAIDFLTKMAEEQVWHINAYIMTARERDSLENLSSHFRVLDALNLLIEYHGGNPVELKNKGVYCGDHKEDDQWSDQRDKNILGLGLGLGLE